MIDVSAFLNQTNGKPVAVFGLGLSNRAVIKALRAAGAAVAAWDDHPDNRAKIDPSLLVDLSATDDFTVFSCLVLAPGVPLYAPAPHPVVEKAKKAGIEIMCDLEILHRCGHGRKTIGVTGTNGKSTTTALIGHILKSCGVDTQVGGNIGKAALDLDLPARDGVFVFEISSFQLDLCIDFAPDIAVHLNITPDHLDRHGDMAGYAAAKQRIFRGRGHAVIGMDDEWSRQMAESVASDGIRDVTALSVLKSCCPGVYVSDAHLFDAMDGGDPRPVAVMDFPALPGLHNYQNAAAAYAAARLIGLDPAQVIAAMADFPGLPHRQYNVRQIGGVCYVNDSKATNAAAAARALACYDHIYWIVGGRAKEGGLTGLEPYAGVIRRAYLIGEAAGLFRSWFEDNNIAYEMSGTLARAVADAHRAACEECSQTGDMAAVLLSPACASWDQFDNFEQRGACFTALVDSLPGEAP